MSRERNTIRAGRARARGRWYRLAAISGIGAAVALGVGALPAGAVDAPSANSIVIGSGSLLAYGAVGQLATLFNAAPGCQQFVPFPSATAPQQLDFSCVTAPTVAANPENPYSDVVLQEPPLGSSLGILQLQDSGAHGATATSNGVSINVFQGVDFATSARPVKAGSSGDLQGLNFVAYAEGGVSWFHYTKVKGTPSASASVTNLSQAQLQGIYNGTIFNWSQVGGASAPIVVFTAPEGAGIQTVWKTFLGFDPVTETTVNCKNPTTSPPSNCVGPGVILQDEDAQIALKAFTSVPSQASYVQPNKNLWGQSGGVNVKPTNATLESDGIFFFSYGGYTTSCKANAGKNCGGSPLAAGTTNALGSIAGVAPTENSILTGAFPVDNFLYNVYSNGSNPNIPVANGATLNFASEDGFLCKPQNATTIDPSNGKNYLAEIQSAIEANGYFPLSGGASSGTVTTAPIDEGSVVHPASSLAPLKGTGAYAAFDTTTLNPNTGDPVGYCVVSTTDGNPAT